MNSDNEFNVENSLTPVPPDKPLLRTVYDTLSTFRRNNASFNGLIIELPRDQQKVAGLTFFMVKNQLWAAGLDSTMPYQIHAGLCHAAKLLNVTPEQLGDIACIKNLNSQSNQPDDNKELHSKTIAALLFVRKEMNPQMCAELQITSSESNPKFNGNHLKEVLDVHGLKSKEIASKIQVVSYSNNASERLPHKSRTISIDLTSSAKPDAGKVADQSKDENG